MVNFSQLSVETSEIKDITETPEVPSWNPRAALAAMTDVQLKEYKKFLAQIEAQGK